jgi:phospholipid-binding lipoprotein MlaA
MVLPLLGPSSVRDASGTAVDTIAFSVVDPFTASSFQWRYPPVLALNVINSRYIQSFRYYQTGSPFEYDLVRFLYIKKRELDIER